MRFRVMLSVCWVFCFLGVFLIERAWRAGKLQSTAAAERPELEAGSVTGALTTASQHGRILQLSHVYLLVTYLACISSLAAVRVLVTTLWPLILHDFFGEFVGTTLPIPITNPSSEPWGVEIRIEIAAFISHECCVDLSDPATLPNSPTPLIPPIPPLPPIPPRLPAPSVWQPRVRVACYREGVL